MWDWSWGWGWWVVMPLMMVAFWGLVAWAVVALVRNDHPGQPGTEQPAAAPPRGDPAEQILAGRFARGEIDADEYRRSLEILRGGSSDRAA